MAFFGGNFTKGPIEQPFVITNKDELVRYFGEPTNSNYNEWFQCSKFFDYGNQLLISRAYTDNKVTAVEATEGLSEGNSDFVMTDVSKVLINSIVSFEDDDFGTCTDAEKIYTVTNISYDSGTEKYTITIDNPVCDTIPVGKMIYVQHEHINAGISAYQSLKEATAPKADYNQYYNLYKNDEDFNFKKETIAIEDEVKLKFIALTAGDVENGIEIAIANPIDFNDYYDATTSTTTGASKAEAFMDLPLSNFFQYPPVGDEIGIVIKHGDETETYVVSFDEAALDGNNKSKYIETVINEQSKLVYVVEKPTLSSMSHFLPHDATSWDENTSSTYQSYNSYIQTQLYKDRQGNTTWIGLPTGNPAPSSLTTYGGQNPIITDSGDIEEAYNEVNDKEYFEVDIIIGNEIDLGAAAINLAVTRADCIAFIGARYQDVVGKRSAEATNALVDYMFGKISGVTPPQRSMFAAYFGNYHKIYDNYAKKYRWINVAGDMAGLRANTNNARASWWASAGLRRGVIRNIDKIAFSPSEPQRDQLYKNSINPIVAFPGEGNLCWGQKTLLNYASSFDRINVRGLFNTIERAMSKAAKSSVFEFNDPFTRNAILAMFNPYLSGVKAGRGVEDFLVVCDTTNNTPNVISRNELVVDIYIKPLYAAEFIRLNFNNVGTRSFSTVIGV